MATKIYEYANQADFLKAFVSGELKGFMPTEKIDSNSLSYPVKIEAQEGNYTFWLYKEPQKAEVKESTNKKGLTRKQKIIIGCSVGGGVILLTIIGIVIWLCVR